MNAAQILRLLDLMLVGAAALDRVSVIRAKIALMVSEGREPTEQEFDALIADESAWTERLDAADKRLNP